MAPFRTAVLVFAATLAFIISESTVNRASAVTAGEVLKKMSKEERLGYLTGLVDMLAYQTGLSGDAKNSSCIVSAFYREGRDENISRMLAAFEQFPDRRPEAIVTLLAKKACGG